jgi:hypothetical protein
MISPPLSGLKIGRGEQGIHLLLLQIRDHSFGALFERDCPNLFAPRDMFWAVSGDEMTESMDRGEALISRGCAAVTDFLDLGKKPTDALLRDFDHGEFIDLLVGFAGRERDQQRKGIAITPLRVS